MMSRNAKRFIHIPKNGGITIRRSARKGAPLEKYVVRSNEDSVSPEYAAQYIEYMEGINEQANFLHIRWRDLNDKAKEDHCFSVVRNPWARVVSRYAYLKARIQQNTISNPQIYKSVPFEEFLEQRHEDILKPYFWHRAIKGWHTQKSYLVDEEGELKCDVLRLETNDVQKYFNLAYALRKQNTSNRTGNPVNYRQYYTVETKKIVEDWYQEDIEFFGFTYCGSATKNIYYT